MHSSLMVIVPASKPEPVSPCSSPRSHPQEVITNDRGHRLLRTTSCDGLPPARSCNHSANESLLVGSDYLAASREQGIVGSPAKKYYTTRESQPYPSPALLEIIIATPLQPLTHGKHVLSRSPFACSPRSLAKSMAPLIVTTSWWPSA